MIVSPVNNGLYILSSYGNVNWWYLLNLILELIASFKFCLLKAMISDLNEEIMLDLFYNCIYGIGFKSYFSAGQFMQLVLNKVQSCA